MRYLCHPYILVPIPAKVPLQIQVIAEANALLPLNWPIRSAVALDLVELVIVDLAHFSNTDHVV